MKFRKVFGSSGYISQPKSVRCSFIQYGNVRGMKSVDRISSLDLFHVHKNGLKPDFRRHWEKDRLKLNHYRIMSKEYWEIKMGRGDSALA